MLYLLLHTYTWGLKGKVTTASSGPYIQEMNSLKPWNAKEKGVGFSSSRSSGLGGLGFGVSWLGGSMVKVGGVRV